MTVIPGTGSCPESVVMTAVPMIVQASLLGSRPPKSKLPGQQQQGAQPSSNIIRIPISGSKYGIEERDDLAAILIGRVIGQQVCANHDIGRFDDRHYLGAFLEAQLVA